MTPPRKFSLVQLDVFSSEPLQGNALAVVLDARGLSDQQMQAFAKETNLSETTYVFPRDAATESQRGVRVRIFTVQEELPFAGHPTLGTAFALRGSTATSEVRLDLNVGVVPVHFSSEAGQPDFGEMTQVDPTFGVVHEPEALARATGLKREEFDPNLPIQSVSTGVEFTIVPLRSLQAIRSLHLDFVRAAEYLQNSGGKFFYFVTREVLDLNARLHARMLFYNGEDPATGSAAGCAAAWMVQHGVAQADERVLIEQGLEMRRPSRIFVRSGKKGDAVVNVRVGGNCIEIMRGEFFL
jgi:trans-2,3-dihydro-3-hydroxyanthranilate isomerase